MTVIKKEGRKGKKFERIKVKQKKGNKRGERAGGQKKQKTRFPNNSKPKLGKCKKMNKN